MNFRLFLISTFILSTLAVNRRTRRPTPVDRRPPRPVPTPDPSCFVLSNFDPPSDGTYTANGERSNGRPVYVQTKKEETDPGVFVLKNKALSWKGTQKFENIWVFHLKYDSRPSQLRQTDLICKKWNVPFTSCQGEDIGVAPYSANGEFTYSQSNARVTTCNAFQESHACVSNPVCLAAGENVVKFEYNRGADNCLYENEDGYSIKRAPYGIWIVSKEKDVFYCHEKNVLSCVYDKWEFQVSGTGNVTFPAIIQKLGLNITAQSCPEESGEESNVEDDKSSNALIAIIVVIAVLVIGIGALAVWRSRNKKEGKVVNFEYGDDVEEVVDTQIHRRN